MAKNPYSGVFIDDGLGEKAKSRYQQRRKDLAKTIGMPIVLCGTSVNPSNNYPWANIYLPIYQEPLILYLTGINQLNTTIFIDPKTNIEILFLAKKNKEKEFWEGARFAYGEKVEITTVQKITGFQTIMDIKFLDNFLLNFFQKKAANKIGALWYQSKKNKRKKIYDYNLRFFNHLKYLIKKTKKKIDLENILDQSLQFRLSLDTADQNNAQKANNIASRALEETLIDISTNKDEMSVFGLISGYLQKRSSFGLSFPPIIASGINALTLHYRKNNDLFEKDNLLLLDFGVRWQNMHSDISRTVPVNGKYNVLQKMLYQIVLNTQKLVEKNVRPGISIKELNNICWQSIKKDLETNFIKKGGKVIFAFKKPFPHFVSHLIGLSVHDGDPFGEYRALPLKEGWLISNEPGLYGHFEIKINGKKYSEDIGIRIEDNLLITKNGCINLSKSIPKEIEDIEKIMACK